MSKCTLFSVFAMTEDLKCKNRGKNFAEKKKLNLRIALTHSSEKGHQCNECNKYFALKSNLNRHIKSFHQKERPEKKFICLSCPFKGRDQYQLSLHSKTHNNIKQFECDVCKFCFVRESDLKRHNKTCQGEKNTCDLCGSVFKNQRLLNDHVLWSPSCGRVKEMQPAEDELSNEERLLHSDLLVRIKASDDNDVVGFKTSLLFNEKEFRVSGRRVSCGVCIGCSRLSCGGCPACLRNPADQERVCTRKKCLHPVPYYSQIKNKRNKTPKEECMTETKSIDPSLMNEPFSQRMDSDINQIDDCPILTE